MRVSMYAHPDALCIVHHHRLHHAYMVFILNFLTYFYFLCYFPFQVSWCHMSLIQGSLSTQLSSLKAVIAFTPSPATNPPLVRGCAHACCWLSEDFPCLSSCTFPSRFSSAGCHGKIMFLKATQVTPAQLSPSPSLCDFKQVMDTCLSLCLLKCKVR